MLTVIARTLPFATAIAISPLPVIVAVLILVSEGARAKSVGYLLGRICAFALVVALVALVIGGGSTRHSTHDHPSTTVSIARVCIGVGLVALAIRLWYRRPRGGADATPNRLWQRVDRVTPARAFGLGIALVIVDVSTLILGIMAGLDIGEARLSVGYAVGAGAVFVALALTTCTAPIVAYLIAGPRLDGSLAAAKTWLVANDKTVMMILFLVLGTVLIGRGIDALATG